ncbi:hypothetical protein AX16_000365 [Volvariella volvacea WC 439]|nr:hypothetical protein AX16_000365 [Volvariella volvacea WC 439]
MGGGDLNMKKSWHPLLLKNQERVWLEEKKALEEKKKLDQLRKEKEEERQLQELQRLQEEKTGKKRTEKLEWMYATPATGSNQNPNDLEDYLLGKKRVDKMLTGDENAKIGASHKNFIAVQNANSGRDIAAKIREDPLFAIKQQEQAALQALVANPLRLKELQERTGVNLPGKKDKKERKREKEERRRLKEHRHHRDRRSRSRSYSPSRPHRRSDRSPSYERRRRSASPRRRSRSPHHSRHSHHYDSRRRSPDYGTSRQPWPRSDESEEEPRHSRRRYDDSPRDFARRGRSRSREYDKRYHRASSRSPLRPSRDSPPRFKQPALSTTEERAARLAAMTADASSLTVERKERLHQLLEKEKAEAEEEERMRQKSKGMGGFLSHESKRVYGGQGDLGDRIRRGRGTMVVDAD